MNYKSTLNNYVSKNLRECQQKQVWILEEVDKICKRHNINYWLDGGTLLGAVRHGGFIPWDDDIDIGMMVYDYELFCQVASSELPSELFLQTSHTDSSYSLAVVKIRDLNSFYIESCDSLSSGYVTSIFIDIFPFIPCPSLNKKFLNTLTKGISKAYGILHKGHVYSIRSIFELFWFLCKYIFLSFVWNILTRVCNTSNFISNIPINNGYGVSHKRFSVFPLGKINFEGKLFSSPSHPEEYLRDLYGDFWVMPPEEKRHVHAVMIIPDLKR